MAAYRTSPNYLRNPKWCVGCFECLRNFAVAHKKGRKLFFFCAFFAEPIFAKGMKLKIHNFFFRFSTV